MNGNDPNKPTTPSAGSGSGAGGTGEQTDDDETLATHLNDPTPSKVEEGEEDLQEGKGAEDAPTHGDEGGGNWFGDGISTEPNDTH